MKVITITMYYNVYKDKSFFLEFKKHIEANY